MNQIRVIILAMLALLVAGRPVEAQGVTRLIVCNKGQIDVRVARAVQYGSFLLGYQWRVEGWYQIRPGDCLDVYPENNWGVFDSNRDIHVAFGFRDSTGVWGAAEFDFKETRGVKPSDKQLCVPDGNEGFRYTQSGANISLLGETDARALREPCKEEYSKMPAAISLLNPANSNDCGDYDPTPCADYEFNFALTAKDRATPVGPGRKAASPGPGTNSVR